MKFISMIFLAVSLHSNLSEFNISVEDQEDQIQINFCTLKEFHDLRPLLVKNYLIDPPRLNKIGKIYLQVCEKSEGFFPQAIGKRSGFFHLQKVEFCQGAYTLFINEIETGTLYVSKQITYFDQNSKEDR